MLHYSTLLHTQVTAEPREILQVGPLLICHLWTTAAAMNLTGDPSRGTLRRPGTREKPRRMHTFLTFKEGHRPRLYNLRDGHILYGDQKSLLAHVSVGSIILGSDR